MGLGTIYGDRGNLLYFFPYILNLYVIKTKNLSFIFIYTYLYVQKKVLNLYFLFAHHFLFTSNLKSCIYPLRLVVPPRHLPLLQGEAELVSANFKVSASKV